jgi:hypothetical protein
MTISTKQLISAEAAKNMLSRKGWTNRALAAWWGCTDEYVSRIINNENRREWFNDAIRGLPQIANKKPEK